jgi:hypothetical protein
MNNDFFCFEVLLFEITSILINLCGNFHYRLGLTMFFTCIRCHITICGLVALTCGQQLYVIVIKDRDETNTLSQLFAIFTMVIIVVEHNV